MMQRLVVLCSCLFFCVYTMFLMVVLFRTWTWKEERKGSSSFCVSDWKVHIKSLCSKNCVHFLSFLMSLFFLKKNLHSTLVKFLLMCSLFAASGSFEYSLWKNIDSLCHFSFHWTLIIHVCSLRILSFIFLFLLYYNAVTVMPPRTSWSKFFLTALLCPLASYKLQYLAIVRQKQSWTFVRSDQLDRCYA